MAETSPPAAPAYGTGALSDLLPSVLAGLGVPGEPRTVDLPDASRVVVLLVDGLGGRLLERHADAAPFLSSLDEARADDRVPGDDGHQPGVVRDRPAAGRARPHRLHVVRRGGRRRARLADLDGRGGSDVRDRFVPETVQPHRTAFERAADDGVEVTVAAPAHFGGSGLTRAVLRGGRWAGTLTPGDVVASAVDGSRRGSRSLVYCYTPDLDLTGHVRGVDSDAWRAQLATVDRFAEQLAAALPAGTVLHVTGDHGMVDAGDRVDLEAVPGLLDGVRAVAGEPRVRHVHAEPGAADDVLARWRDALGELAWVGSRDDAVRAGLLGPVVTPAALRRTGDVVAVATGTTVLVRPVAEALASGLVGHHGALTDDERLVPLLST